MLTQLFIFILNILKIWKHVKDSMYIEINLLPPLKHLTVCSLIIPKLIYHLVDVK